MTGVCLVPGEIIQKVEVMIKVIMLKVEGPVAGVGRRRQRRDERRMLRWQWLRPFLQDVVSASLKQRPRVPLTQRVRKRVALQLGCKLCEMGRTRGRVSAMPVAGTIFCRRIIG
jgi:hypothetical protein